MLLADRASWIATIRSSSDPGEGISFDLDADRRRYTVARSRLVVVPIGPMSAEEQPFANDGAISRFVARSADLHFPTTLPAAGTPARSDHT